MLTQGPGFGRWGPTQELFHRRGKLILAHSSSWGQSTGTLSFPMVLTNSRSFPSAALRVRMTNLFGKSLDSPGEKNRPPRRAIINLEARKTLQLRNLQLFDSRFFSTSNALFSWSSCRFFGFSSFLSPGFSPGAACSSSPGNPPSSSVLSATSTFGVTAAS